MSRDVSPPFTYLNAVTAAAQGLKIQMGLNGLNGMSFHTVWTGNIVGTVTIEGSNDPLLVPATTAAEEDAADWVDITALVTTLVDPAGVAGNNMAIVNNSRFWWIRLGIGSVSGTGTFSVYPASHGAG